MLCVIVNFKKSRFLKEQEVKWLLGDLLGAKIPILGDILFENIKWTQ